MSLRDHVVVYRLTDDDQPHTTVCTLAEGWTPEDVAEAIGATIARPASEVSVLVTSVRGGAPDRAIRPLAAPRSIWMPEASWPRDVAELTALEKLMVDARRRARRRDTDAARDRAEDLDGKIKRLRALRNEVKYGVNTD